MQYGYYPRSEMEDEIVIGLHYCVLGMYAMTIATVTVIMTMVVVSATLMIAMLIIILMIISTRHIHNTLINISTSNKVLKLKTVIILMTR